MVAGINGTVPSPDSVSEEADKSPTPAHWSTWGLHAGTKIEGHHHRHRLPRVLYEWDASKTSAPRPRSSTAIPSRPGCAPLVVPGSQKVKAQAEREGLDQIFKTAGFEWREPGCSMCLGMNPDILAPGERCASTSNRNFEGRQGRGGRTHLVSPVMAAAARHHRPLHRRPQLEVLDQRRRHKRSKIMDAIKTLTSPPRRCRCRTSTPTRSSRSSS